jgi:hypothetical protein
MARILLEFVLPILLPSLLYALWLVAMQRRAETSGTEQRRWSDAPWIWLLALGLFFAALLTVALSVFSGDGIEGRYVPPQLENGRIVPGHVEPR